MGNPHQLKETFREVQNLKIEYRGTGRHFSPDRFSTAHDCALRPSEICWLHTVFDPPIPDFGGDQSLISIPILREQLTIHQSPINILRELQINTCSIQKLKHVEGSLITPSRL
jgi:hypothetical protein